MRTGGCCCTCKGSQTALENFNEDHKLHLHAAILKEHMGIQRATALPKKRNNNARKSPSNRTHLDEQTTMEYLRNLGNNCKQHVTSTQPLHERIHSSCADQTFKEIIHIPHSAPWHSKSEVWWKPGMTTSRSEVEHQSTCNYKLHFLSDFQPTLKNKL